MTLSLTERFDNGYEPEPNTGCWLWKRAAFKNVGYGAIGRKGPNGSWRLVGAHRISWELAHGEAPPPGMQVCHKCDERLCVNPAHLYVGTAKDNAQDRQRRGRGNALRGERHGQARLTEVQVRSIRERYSAGGIFMRELAAEHGVSMAAVLGAIRRRTWRHIN